MRFQAFSGPLSAILLLGCATFAGSLDPDLKLDFAGPGRLAVIWHQGDPDDDPSRRLVIYDRDGAHPLAIERPVEVRWIGSAELLVEQGVPSEEPGVLPRTRLLRVRLDGRADPLTEPRRAFGIEPAPGGDVFALSVDINDEGESNIEIWSLDGEPRRLAKRRQNLEEPRWSPDASMLVVSRIVDPLSDEDGGGLSFGGQTVPFPRLFHGLERDLVGALQPIHDGARDGPPVAGGSLPAWWDERGIFARQRTGLVRCKSPESGCSSVFEVPEGWRLVEARPEGSDRALLLLADGDHRFEGLPTEIREIELKSGAGRRLHPVRDRAFPLDLDWTHAP